MTEPTTDTTRSTLLEQTREHVRATLDGEGTGHDWFHIERVCRVALRLAGEEGADPYVVELAALLHDIADWKFHDGDIDAGPRQARAWLESLEAEPGVVDHVCDIVASVSFKGAGVATPMRTVEGAVVQDADRLDAIGAIGIARCFAYGGHRGNPIHDPRIEPTPHDSFDAYKKGDGPSTNHFHEKLLLLRERMNTDAGRALADERHAYMVAFLERFEHEWEGRA